jgi:perosamine synthetase
MIKQELALLGGPAVRDSQFKSTPMITDEEIGLVTKLMQEGRFSKFVGSPIEGTRENLKKKSIDLISEGDGFSFLGGEYVRKFEAEWSKLVESDYCISVNSATSGLTTALLGLGLDPGSEVITTPFSFTATAASIVAAHCIPVFCDIDPNTFCLDPSSLKKVISKKTKCVMPVHWCGNAGDLDLINSFCKENNLYMVEDAAQAPATIYKCKNKCHGCNSNCDSLNRGRPIGTFGDVSVFSFNEPKNMMTGEGGIIVTDNKKIAEKCRLIRNHGEAIVNDDDDEDYLNNVVGYNFRLTELQAAIGSVQIKKLKRLNSIRKENYLYLRNNLEQNFGEYLSAQKITHLKSYFSYTAAFRWHSNKHKVHRNVIADALIAEGVPVFRGYNRLMCDHPMFKKRIAFGLNQYPWMGNKVNYNTLSLPNARNLLENEFLGFLQLGWPNTIKDMDEILLAMEKIVCNMKKLESFSKKTNDNFILGR